MAQRKKPDANAVADYLENALLNERKTLTESLKEIDLDRSTYAKMILRDPEFEKRVTVYRELCLHLMEDELLEIADDASLGFALRRDMIDTRKWILARRVERYRDKKDITTDGKPLLVSDI